MEVSRGFCRSRCCCTASMKSMVYEHCFFCLEELYFLMPQRFLQECIHSAGFHQIPQESTGIQWNGTGIQWNEPGLHWIVTGGTCISACKYKCVYINRLCGLSVSLSLSRYTLPYLGQISHDTMIVALSLTFLTILKSSYLVSFLWGKMQKGWKKSLIRTIIYLISPQWEHFIT